MMIVMIQPKPAIFFASQAESRTFAGVPFHYTWITRP
jgi:hypothetical protein